MAKSQIKISAKDDSIVIENDNNFESFLSMSLIFYHKIIDIMQKTQGLLLAMNPNFQNLIIKLSTNEKEIKLSKEDLKIMTDWIDCLCLIMLDLDSIDFKNKQIKKYLSFSEQFIKKSKKLTS